MKTDNELIANFMGYVHSDDPHTDAYEMSRLEYDQSWDWLMPVIQKIDDLHDSNIDYDPEKIAKGDWPKDDEYIDVIALPMNTSIFETYNAVVEFIKWYNRQTV